MMVGIRIDSERCKGCELCISVCKKEVIALSKKFNKMSYRFAEVVNEENCSGCANCAIICPDVCIEIMKGEKMARRKKLTKKDVPQKFIKEAERIFTNPNSQFVPLDEVVKELGEHKPKKRKK